IRHLPAWVLCSYNANGTPDPILEGVWQTHPEVVDATTWTTSELYQDRDNLLRRITPAPEPLPELRSIPPARDPEQLRERLARDDPATGYLAPRAGLGTGLGVARQLTWRIEFFQSDRGFTARIWL